VVDRNWSWARGGPRVLVFPSFDQVLCPDSGVDRRRMLGGGCILGQAGNGNARCLAARAADDFSERLGRAECGGSRAGCQRPHQGKWPIWRPEIRKGLEPRYPINGVLDAAHALDY